MDLMIKVILQNIMVKKAQESKQTHHFQSWHWEVKTFEKFEELSLLYSAHPRVSTAWGGRPRGHSVHFPSSIVEDICTALLGKLKRGKNTLLDRLVLKMDHPSLWCFPRWMTKWFVCPSHQYFSLAPSENGIEVSQSN